MCQKTLFLCTLWLVRCFQFQGMIWKTKEYRVSKTIALKNGNENPDYDFVPLFFTLLTSNPFILRPVSVVSAICFKYLGPCRWFQVVLDRFRSFQFVPRMVLARFRWFQVVLDHFRPFQLLPHFSKYRLKIVTVDGTTLYTALFTAVNIPHFLKKTMIVKVNLCVQPYENQS